MNEFKCDVYILNPIKEEVLAGGMISGSQEECEQYGKSQIGRIRDTRNCQGKVVGYKVWKRVI